MRNLAKIDLFQPRQHAQTHLAFNQAHEGAFPLAADSKDSAILVTLLPGQYSAVVSGVGAATGAGLVEVYVVPNP